MLKKNNSSDSQDPFSKIIIELQEKILSLNHEQVLNEAFINLSDLKSAIEEYKKLGSINEYLATRFNFENYFVAIKKVNDTYKASHNKNKFASSEIEVISNYIKDYFVTSVDFNEELLFTPRKESWRYVCTSIMYILPFIGSIGFSEFLNEDKTNEYFKILSSLMQDYHKVHDNYILTVKTKS